MDSKWFLQSAFSIWVYVFRVPENPPFLPFSSGQVMEQLSSWWRPKSLRPWLSSLHCCPRTGKARVVIPRPIGSPELGTHSVVPRCPEAQERLRKTGRLSGEHALSSPFSKPFSLGLLLTQPWLQKCVPSILYMRRSYRQGKGGFVSYAYAFSTSQGDNVIYKTHPYNLFSKKFQH